MGKRRQARRPVSPTRPLRRRFAKHCGSRVGDAGLLLFLLANFALADFANRILPVLDTYCADCHDAEDDLPFLELTSEADLQSMRGLWRSVAAQLRQRTMPPADKRQPDPKERQEVADWIETHLAATACAQGPYAGHVPPRRLNRLEYDNTIRDLMGVSLHFAETLPFEGGAGEGFDTNAESLFMPPMLMERYLDAAQQIVDAAIISPPLDVRIPQKDFVDGQTALVSVFVDDDYRIELEGEDFVLAVDGVDVGAGQSRDMRLTRGLHTVTVGKGVTAVRVKRHDHKPDDAEIANHKRLVGLVHGHAPKDARAHARARLAWLLPLAFRRPVTDAEIARFMPLYDRAAERGDPFEERLKLLFRAVLVAPEFLYRIETSEGQLSDYELASRLSYFLWSTMPDRELRKLAAAGELGEPAVLADQVRRLLADPQSAVFAKAFMGQWLGTKDVGGRKAPTANDVQKYYTPDIAADMREEVVRFFHYLITEDRSLLELVDADYAFLTRRLAKWYGMEGLNKQLPKNGFGRVKLPNARRGGLLGMGAVLALTSHHKRTSPVLRGAWVFDTLLGTPVPPPPADVPPLAKSKGKNRSLREQVEAHRQHKNCKACHELIDPIGFALENFDWVGRWRDKADGKSIDNKGVLPGGKPFAGPRELRKTLLAEHQDAISRQFVRKLMAYALGRGLTDRDDCIIAQLTDGLAANNHSAQSLIQALVASDAFHKRLSAP